MKVFIFLFLIAVSFAVFHAESSTCLQPVEGGRCLGYMKRYAYTRDKGCEEFIYGGCGGNENNFQTYEECQKKCLIPR